MDTFLVTGGAGYIGSHACKALKRAGFLPVTFDSLAKGWEDAVRFGPFEKGDLLDRERIEHAIRTWSPVAVLHFAALSLVSESVRNPGLHWRNNVTGTLNLVEAMVGAGCLRMVFSSTCSIYGETDGLPVTENSPELPGNPYAATKRASEDMLLSFRDSHGLESVRFRYFNVAGADPDCEIGEHHRPETHLVPLVLNAITDEGGQLEVFGTDYPTPDGTCIRDYIHVSDLVDAHILGLKRLLHTNNGQLYNLGAGRGHSVREVIRECREVTERNVPVKVSARRPGDVSCLVSGSDRAEDELGWRRRRSDLRTIIKDAWNWHLNGGFSG